MQLLFDPPETVVAQTTYGRGFPVRRLLCLGRNYADHAKELGNAVKTDDLPFFTKWAEAAAPSGAEIPYPPGTEDWQFEVELVAAIFAPGTDIAPERALEHVWGYAVGIDMTRRDLQRKSKEAGAPWDWAKNGPHTAPLGPISPAEETGVMTRGGIRLYQNETLRQSGDLSDMIWDVATTISYISRYFALAPGDLIFTGTPAGVGPAAPGDALRGEIDGLASVEVTIAAPIGAGG